MTKLKKPKLWHKSKTHIGTKFKSQTVTKHNFFLFLQNSKTQSVTQLKNLNCDKTEQFVLIKLENLNCDKTQKHKLWQNSKTEIVTKLKKTQMVTKFKVQIVTKLKTLNCEKIVKFKLWPNSKTQIVTN